MKIIGLSCNLPKSNNVKEFENNLFSNVDMVSENEDRFIKGINDIPKRIGTLPDIESFDNILFGINSKQAEKMDPQIRLSLENSLGCIIDSGIDPDSLRGKKVGVYSGACFSDSMTSQLHDPNLMDGREMVGNALSMIANRVSFYFDFKGPSCNYDTACSSSLVALDKAFNDLNSDIIEYAIVIGSSLILNPGGSVGFARYKMLSPDGKCSSYDDSANGYVRSEGSVAILITKSENFTGNYYAEILGTGVNSDGYTERGITYPSSDGQKNLYEDIYKRFNIDKSKVTYIEGHGTGTVAGDAQELKGLSDFFNHDLLIGSVKSNMGHSEGCSGLAGIVKVLLTFKNKVIPSNLHFKNPNKFLLDNCSNFKIVSENTEWKGGLVGINSYGFGGTNAHAVLKEGNLESDLRFFKSIYKGNVYRGITDLEKSVIENDNNYYVDPKYCFLYTGNGANYLGMAKDIFKDPIGNDVIIKCHNHLKLIDHNIDLINIFLDNIHQSECHTYGMIVLTALQLALTEVLKTKYNLKPSCIIGHSSGELPSAYADDLVTIEECIELSYVRGKCIDSLKDKGLMLAIASSYEESKLILLKLFGDEYYKKITVGCDNSPLSSTISGYTDEVCLVEKYCIENNIFSKKVETLGIGFHSPQLEKIYDLSVNMFEKHIPKREMTRSNKWISTASDSLIYNSNYIVKGFTGLVKFREAVSKLPENTIVIEIGPAGLLKNSILQSNENIKYVASQKFKKSMYEGLKIMKENLWLDFGINLENIKNIGALNIHKNLIIENNSSKFPTLDPSLWVPKHVPFSNKNQDSIYCFKRDICEGHVIDDRVLVPATGTIYAVWETFVGKENINNSKIEINDLKIKRALVFEENDNEINVKIKLNSYGDFYLTTLNDELVSSGKIKSINKNIDDVTEIIEENANYVNFNKNDYYNLLRSKGYQYKNNFQSIEWINNKNGLIKFNDWISYLDCMLQSMLKSHDDLWDLRLPTEISKIIIDGTKNLNSSIINTNYISYNDLGNYVKSSNVEIYQLKTSSAQRLKQKGMEIFAKYEFLKYGKKKLEWNKNDDDYHKLCLEYLTKKLEDFPEKEHMKKFKSKSIRENIENIVQEKLNNDNDDDGNLINLQIINEMDFEKYNKNPLKEINNFRRYDEYYGPNNNLVGKFYKNYLKYAMQICIENTKNLNIFEIGSGTGGLTKEVIQHLKSYADLNYEFTCSDYFNGYLQKLKQIDSIIKTQQYDINTKLEKDKYNLILGCNSIHVGKNIKDILNNLFDALLPGGFLILSEVFSDFITLLFGWDNSTWNFNDEREKGLWISNDRWVSYFEEIGFSIVLNSYYYDSYFFLLYKPSNKNIVNVIPDFNNIDNFKLILKENKDNIINIKSNEDVNGIYGFIKSLNREKDLPKVIYSNCRSEYEELTFNIFKDNKIGTWIRCDNEFNHLPKNHNYGTKLFFETLGDLNSKCWIENRPPNDNENLKINIKYSSLNFKDVMLSYGKISKDSIKGFSKNGFVGFEMAGVTDEGHRLMGFGLDSISNIIHTNKNLVWDIPDNWSFQDAATIPTVYSTAYYSLFMRANLKPGNSILIHAGTGGVGLAAITLALNIDCEVYTTCSNETKKNFLLNRFPKLKESNISNSRDNSFEDLIMKKTKGKGVDVVLNSLSEELLKSSLRCVAQHGSFIEIGKYDFINNSKLDLLPFINNISFHGVDLDQLLLNINNNTWNDLYYEIKKLIKQNVIIPLPYTEFNSDKTDDAFRFLASGNHIGKVLINFDNFKPINKKNKFYADQNKSYIIHGGLGGFGLMLIRWLSEKGAKEFIITSRSGIKTGEQQYHINCLKEKGVKINVFIGDIGEKDNFIKFEEQLNNMSPVDGIFILSMVLNDSLFLNMNQKQWDETVNAKIKSTILLDEWSRFNKVTHFMGWSSCTSGFGNSGQANYAYGNSYLEQIIQNRNNNNLSGITIQWGPIGDVGFVSNFKISSFSNLKLQLINRCLNTIDYCLSNNLNGTYCNYFYNNLLNTTINDENESLIDYTCKLIGVKFNDKLKNTSLNELGFDSLLTTNLQNKLNKKNINLTLDQITNLTLLDIQNFN